MEQLPAVKECIREQPHDGPCNGWPCEYVRNKFGLDKFGKTLPLPPPRKCETKGCDHGIVEPQYGKLDQTHPDGLPAAIFHCQCGWVRHQALRGEDV